MGQFNRQEDRPLGTVFREVLTGFRNLLQSEIHLIQAEIQLTFKDLKRNAVLSAVFGGFVVVSILPFLAFLIIGLGKLLGDNYWLSSFIIFIVCLTVGGFFGFYYFRKLTQKDFVFSHTRSSIQNEAEVIQRRIRKVSDMNSRKIS